MVTQSPKVTPSRRTPYRSPVSKKTKQSWTTCQNCNMRTMLNHDCDLAGPCISANITKLNVIYKDSIYCHLNPDTLQEMGLKIGTFVRIESDVFECWPDTTILLDNVGFASQNRALVTVQIIENIKNAAQVTITVDGKVEKSYLPFVLQNKVIFRGQEISVPYFSNNLTMYVHSVSSFSNDPSNDFGVSSLTESLSDVALVDTYFKILPTTTFIEKSHPVTLPKLIGSDEIIEQIIRIINQSLGEAAMFGVMGPPKTLLLSGASGSGKTLLAMTVLQSTSYSSCSISDFTKDLITEDHVKLVLLDGLESVREDENDKIGKICNFLSSLPSYAFVLATALYMPGSLRKFFPLQIEMPAMTTEIRYQIFKTYIDDLSNVQGETRTISDDDIYTIAAKSHGYVGADICNVCRQAFLFSQSGKLTMADLMTALTKVPPRSMNEIKIEVPEVRWTDIGGLTEVQELLTKVITWPLIYQDKYHKMGITPPKGVLMYGPPGCCKTMMAKALATESGLNFLSVKGPELLSMYVGESERAIRDLFARARTAAPAIVFFDEIDALATHRGADKGSGVNDRVLAQMLTELDGIEGLAGVVTIAATNRPDRLDKALLRPGRLEKMVYIPPPDLECIKEILKIKFSKIPHEGLDFDVIAEAMDGFSGAEVVAACHGAGIESITSDCVTPEIMSSVISNIVPQISQDSLEYYQTFNSTR